MIQEPLQLFGYLAGITGFLFWLGSLKRFESFFGVLPPIVWVYLVPSLLTAAGLTPSSHSVYDMMAYILLPFALFLLTITIDLKAVLGLGKMALGMMMVGTAGVVIGTAVSYMVFRSYLPADGWQSLASLAGSWIGGTGNMVAIQQSLEAPSAILGPVIIVDSVVGYGWFGILIFLAAFQKRFDAAVGADRSALDRLDQQLKESKADRIPAELPTIALIVGLGLAIAAAARALSVKLPVLGDPTVISHSTWAILIVVTLGLAVSFTRVRDLERSGASTIGYYGLYLMVASIGASADLTSLIDAPAFALAGLLAISIHIGLLLAAAKLFRAPLFFVATGSMANIGGAATAPIMAGVYMPALAPVGLLMAVVGYVLGIYAALGGAKLLAMLSTI